MASVSLQTVVCPDCGAHSTGGVSGVRERWICARCDLMRVNGPPCTLGEILMHGSLDLEGPYVRRALLQFAEQLTEQLTVIEE